MFRKFVFAPRTRRTRGAGYTVVREDGSAQDSARANTPDWRDGIGALQHLCRSAVVWPDARWVDHDDADCNETNDPPSLRVFTRSFDFFHLIQQKQPQQLYQVLQSAAVARTQQVVVAAILPTAV